MFASASLARSLAVAAALYAVDDGDKIKEDEAPGALARGEENPVWAPGKPIRLIALKNETVSFQVVVAAGDEALSGVTVDLEALRAGAGAIANAPGATDPARFVGRPIERFVEHFLDVPRASGGAYAGESLGWAPGSGPPPGRWTGRIPDALIPVEIAPAWRPYPLAIAPRKNGIVWIDVTIGARQPAGVYRGDVVVRAQGEALGTLPIELDVADATLPDRPLRTMLGWDRSELDRRLGKENGDAAEKHLLQLFHRHRVAPMLRATELPEVKRQLPALDGSLYTAAQGYEGPAPARGVGVLALGAFGELGDPGPEQVRFVAEAAALLAATQTLATTDAFVYAEDEDCASPRAAAWKKRLGEAGVQGIRVGWTCNEDPAKQPVDIVMQEARLGRARGKAVWTYNGRLPWTGTVVTDAPATSLRADGWIAALWDVERWFLWETTAWFDENKGGHGPFDPFVKAETFHNASGDWSMGDGVLVYPGTQVAPFSHSLGFAGVVASIRLKNWRRGIEDAGYYHLAHAADPARAERIARELVPAAFETAKEGKPAAWPDASKPWFDARAKLRALIPPGTDGGPGRGAEPAKPATSEPPPRCGCRGCHQGGGSALLVGLVWLAASRRRRSASRHTTLLLASNAPRYRGSGEAGEARR
ncbi:MAG: DUF4091 domain-containing protein [Labilithrix sp.]|nr:DUF4091 domain-containing protein [Labilithrix sp.]MCW5811271.1 DUF4091 domain-containing protein [Labilithrix sp.]